MLFRFLHEEEKSNGVLLYARIGAFVNVVSIPLLAGGYLAGVFIMCMHHSALLVIITLFGGEVFAITMYVALIGAVESWIIEPSRNILRKEVEALIAKLGADTILKQLILT
jgi:hypothetical protein